MKLTDIGTEEFPVRASSLNNLVKCPGLFVLKNMDDSSGPAADTGTAVGRAIELYHRQHKTSEIIKQVKAEAESARHPFPLARWSEVEKMFNSYCADPRNPRHIVLQDSQEEEVKLVLPAHERDPTGKPITVTGHLDQVRRREDGAFEVWDLKSGKAQGVEMLAVYLWQQIAYTVAYAQKYPDRDVKWGGIIRLRGYEQKTRRRPNPEYDGTGRKTIDVPLNNGQHFVFYASALRKRQYEAIIKQIRLAVAYVRSGGVILRPGAHCRYCPGDSIVQCTRRLRKVGFDV